MKKTLFIFLSICITVMAQAVSPTTISVVSSAGGLSTAIITAGGNLTTVTNLTVTGTIDARDFNTMHENMPALTDIDLSGVNVADYIGKVGDRTYDQWYMENEIPSYAFISKVSLSTIILPLSITSILEGAFENCSALSSVTIPNSVVYIGVEAFRDCSSLSSIIIPNSVKTIRFSAFANCTSLGNINIPASVSSISRSTFPEACNVTIDPANQTYSAENNIIFNKAKTEVLFSLYSTSGVVNLPNTVAVISSSAFRDCSEITSISIPNSTTTIGSSAFSNCTSLSSITLPDALTTIQPYTFSNCSSLSSIAIPNSVTSIGSLAFSNCTSLSSIILPDALTTIEDNTFSNCTTLNSISIPNSVTSIGQSAFSNCTSLSSITLPNALTTVEYNAFSNCTTLSSISIPNFVTSIEYGAFLGTGITSVSIPASVSSLSTSAFPSNCIITIDANNQTYSSENDILYNKAKTVLLYCPESKTGIVNLPNTLLEIPEYAFKNRTKITSVIIPNSVTEIESYTFEGCTSLSSCIFPQSLKQIYGHAFNYVHVSAYDIPASTTYIHPGSLGSFDAITVDVANPRYMAENDVLYSKAQDTLFACAVSKTIHFTVPNTVTCIEDSAFMNCDKLTSITIPSAVNKIGASAFENCTGLDSIYVHATTPPSFMYWFYNNCLNGVDTTNCKLYVPAGCKAAYQNAAVWKSFNIIEEIPSTKVNEAITNCKITVSKQGQLIVKELPENESLIVYNVQGTVLAQEKSKGGNLSINLPAHGVYVVRVGTQSSKVIY